VYISARIRTRNVTLSDVQDRKEALIVDGKKGPIDASNLGARNGGHSNLTLLENKIRR
jgi:hypothetical protein